MQIWSLEDVYKRQDNNSVVTELKKECVFNKIYKGTVFATLVAGLIISNNTTYNNLSVNANNNICIVDESRSLNLNKSNNINRIIQVNTSYNEVKTLEINNVEGVDNMLYNSRKVVSVNGRVKAKKVYRLSLIHIYGIIGQNTWRKLLNL